LLISVGDTCAQVTSWKKAHPGKYPELAALNYTLMHELSALPASTTEHLRNRWYTWWLAYTVDLGIVALHPPAHVAVVQPQQPARAKHPTSLGLGVASNYSSFLDRQRSPLISMGDILDYRAHGTFNLLLLVLPLLIVKTTH
jgi:hypothetical protein